MKKILSTMLLALMIAVLSTGSASAQKGKVNIKGEVVSVAADTLTVQSNKGQTYVVTVPAGFDTSAVQVGASVLVKGQSAEGDTIIADSIKLVGRGSNNNAKDKPEGFKENSAFCAEGKQEKPHPLAPNLAERYGVTQEWVMERFCEGYSIGAIMLAIRTSQMEGMTASPDDLLADRAAGNGWGLIWRELGLIGSEKNGQSPPGWLKRPDHAGPKNK